MSRPPPDAPDTQPLPEAFAKRLIARASELDAADAATAAIADLRAAASEAGISNAAFDAALAEMRAADAPARPTVASRRVRRVWLGGGLVAFLVLAGIVLSRLVMPAGGGVALVTHTRVLQCIPSAQAAELMRPTLAGLPTVTLQAPTSAPRVLTIRGSRDQLRRAEAALDRIEESGAAACAAPAAAPLTDRSR
ncbi:MAG TPA: hypothetical protein VM764_01085 [Gemmatimonadaceae bacterium]|nr:hypothetical protein [Gemmatimonadaceae bacterium]